MITIFRTREMTNMVRTRSGMPDQNNPHVLPKHRYVNYFMLPSFSLMRRLYHLWSHDSGHPPLCLAAFLYNGRTFREVMDWLLWLGYDVNEKRREIGQNAVFDAICNPDVDVLHALIGAGADVNVQDKFGNTALMCSVWQGGQIEKTRALLAAGANKELRNDEGKVAPDYAVRDGHARIVELFDAN
jgi:hypothetical protein